MRALKQYNTGDEAVDNALDRIHSLTLRGPDDWNIPGQEFDDWLVEMIRAMERLPERHPVRSCSYRLYTAGSHWRWDPSRTAEFYEKFTTELYPLLDSVEINSPTIDRKPDPVATHDHLVKVASTKDPIKAISEFVWNALDADADEVSVEFQTNALGGGSRQLSSKTMARALLVNGRKRLLRTSVIHGN